MKFALPVKCSQGHEFALQNHRVVGRQVVRALKQARQLLDRQIHVTQNRPQQTGANDLAGMNWNGCDSSVEMLQKNMAAASSLDDEARPLKSANEFSSPNARTAGHTVTC